MERRSAFVAEVAATIKARHGQEQESFVLGLSGKWGEGKSHFLGQLRKNLEADAFEVIDLNPWKYAADRVAFLRAFLIQLLETQSAWSRICAAARLVWRGDLHDAWMVLRPRRRMVDGLKTDVTRQRISISRLLLLLIPILAMYWLYTHQFAEKLSPIIQELRLPISLVLIPVSVWLVQGLVNSQASSKAVTAIDEFDCLVSLAIGAPNRSNDACPGVRRIVVFVDDLDRVTAGVARGVLDNLRTFFDKPSLSFVVTGDHSVLEASLGRELAPDRIHDQLEEGRRFMKKVFNLYWRLPLPVRSDFESFVDQQLLLKDEEIKARIPSLEDQALLRQWLLDFCDMNLRLVIRTLDMLLFTLNLVRAQVGAANEEERSGLQEMLEKPMFLGRVLLIQDRCAPLFEFMAGSPSLLVDMDRKVALAKETGATGGDLDPVEKFVEELAQRYGNVGLSPDQLEFLKRFAYQPPLFYDTERGGQMVEHPGPWLHLAGDLSFTDASGPTPEDFVRDTANLNAEALSAAMARCSEAKAQAAADAAMASLTDSGAADDTGQVFKRLLLLLRLVAEQTSGAPLASSVVHGVLESLERFVNFAVGTQRYDMTLALLPCLDTHGARLTDDQVELLRLDTHEEFARLPREAYGPIASVLLAHSLAAYYFDAEEDCVVQMSELLPHMAGEEATAVIAEHLDQFIEDLVSEQDQDAREMRYGVIVEHVVGGKDAVRDAVLDSVDQEVTWSWAMGHAREADGAQLWSEDDLMSKLTEWVAASDDANTLLGRLGYSRGKLDPVADRLWRVLLAQREQDLYELLDRMAADSSLEVLQMPGDIGTALYESRAMSVIDTEDEQLAMQLIAPLNPTVWMWGSIDKKAARKALTPMARKRARRAELQIAVRPFWETWGTAEEPDVDAEVE
jgi:hypothetical protein